MKTFIKYLLAAMLLLPAMAFADLKIGVVNVERILREAPQVEAMNQTLIARFSERKSSLVDVEKEIRSMQERYKKDELIMSEEKKTELKETIIKKIQEFKKTERVLAQEVNTVKNQEIAVFQDSVKNVLVEIAKAEKYDLILSEGVVFSKDKLDVTNKALKNLKKAFKK